VRKILLIEDNQADAVLLAEVLKGAGGAFELSMRQRLADGVELAQRESFDLVLLDLTLPDSSGLGTVRQAVGALPHLPVVVLTGVEDEQIGLDALRAGAQDYLVKGCMSADTIARSARYAIERHRVLTDLREARDHLEEKVLDRTAELGRTVEMLAEEVRLRLAAEEERRAAQMEVLLATEREQRRIGRDLHDSIQGTLAGIDLILVAQEKALVSGRSQPVEVGRRLAEISAQVRQANRQTRGLARGLCPLELAGRGLAEALELGTQTVNSLYGVHCSFRAAGDVALEDELVASQVYYTVQEALTNAIKHARCKKIEISLERKGDVLVASVQDDGIGLPASAKEKGGLGLKTMSYRAMLIGAAVSLEPCQGHGTRMVMTLPLVAPRAAKSGGAALKPAV
jgi:signal transduction histidine kinase